MSDNEDEEEREVNVLIKWPSNINVLLMTIKSSLKRIHEEVFGEDNEDM